MEWHRREVARLTADPVSPAFPERFLLRCRTPVPGSWFFVQGPSVVLGPVVPVASARRTTGPADGLRTKHKELRTRRYSRPETAVAGSTTSAAAVPAAPSCPAMSWLNSGAEVRLRRLHRSLGVTPAMKAGTIDHAWDGSFSRRVISCRLVRDARSSARMEPHAAIVVSISRNHLQRWRSMKAIERSESPHVNSLRGWRSVLWALG
jgi:hypothetical protein